MYFLCGKETKKNKKIMAYNKRQKLNDNIEAIRIALQLERENRQATLEELTALRKYSGFGGLKFILNPRNNPGEWKAGDKPFYEDTVRLFNLLADYGEKDGNFRDFEEMQASLKEAIPQTEAVHLQDRILTRMVHSSQVHLSLIRILHRILHLQKKHRTASKRSCRKCLTKSQKIFHRRSPHRTIPAKPLRNRVKQ